MVQVPTEIAGWAGIVALLLAIWAVANRAPPKVIVRLLPVGFAALIILILWMWISLTSR